MVSEISAIATAAAATMGDVAANSPAKSTPFVHESIKHDDLIAFARTGGPIIAGSQIKSRQGKGPRLARHFLHSRNGNTIALFESQCGERSWND